MLGPSVVLTGLPLGLVYSLRASRRAPDRAMSKVALGLAMFALLALAFGLVNGALSR